MSIWSIFTKSEPSLSLESSNTVPAPPPESCAPAVPTSMWEQAHQNSVRPFEAEAIGALVTHRGISHAFTKPSERYSLVDAAGANEIRAYARAQRAARFTAMAEANAMVDQFFNDGTFSAGEWDVPSQSGAQSTQTDNLMMRVG